MPLLLYVTVVAATKDFLAQPLLLTGPHNMLCTHALLLSAMH